LIGPDSDAGSNFGGVALAAAVEAAGAAAVLPPPPPLESDELDPPHAASSAAIEIPPVAVKNPRRLRFGPSSTLRSLRLGDE
jgi:hypothetical protein